MTVQETWIGSVFVVDWSPVDTAGNPIADTGVVVTGTIARPSGPAADMGVEHTGGTSSWRLTYAPPAAGTYGWKATAVKAGLPAGAVGGSFVVNRDLTGAAPITLDTSTPIGVVRLLITDTDEAFPLFTDADVQALLDLEGGNVKRGAAAALETIGTSETLIAKKITTQDLSTDGPAVAKDLRERAKTLRDQADKADADADEDADGFGFDFIDMPRGGADFASCTDWEY